MRALVPLRSIAALALCAALHGCAHTVLSPPMALCDGTPSAALDEKIADLALRKASAWNLEEGYGETCVVCAEVHVRERGDFAIHVTSPRAPNELFGTSASLEFTRSAHLVDARKFHSCSLRRAPAAR